MARGVINHVDSASRVIHQGGGGFRFPDSLAPSSLEPNGMSRKSFICEGGERSARPVENKPVRSSQAGEDTPSFDLLLASLPQ